MASTVLVVEPPIGA